MGQNGAAVDTQTGQSLLTFTGHIEPVMSVALSADGKRIFTGLADGTVRVWKLGAQRASLLFHVRGRRVAILDAGRLLHLLAQRRKPDRLEDQGQFATGLPHRPVRSSSASSSTAPTCSAICSRTRPGKGSGEGRKESGRQPSKPRTIANALPPVVLITKPDMDGDTDKEMIAIEAIAVSVGDHPVTRMRLLIDGRPYRATCPPSPSQPQTRQGETHLASRSRTGSAHCAGDRRQRVSEGRSDTLRIRRKAIKETLPRLFVLAVGISAYQKQALRKGVYYCAADARKFADTIEKSSQPLYRDVKVVA